MKNKNYDDYSGYDDNYQENYGDSGYDGYDAETTNYDNYNGHYQNPNYDGYASDYYDAGASIHTNDSTGKLKKLIKPLAIATGAVGVLTLGVGIASIAAKSKDRKNYEQERTRFLAEKSRLEKSKIILDELEKEYADVKAVFDTLKDDPIHKSLEPVYNTLTQGTDKYKKQLPKFDKCFIENIEKKFKNYRLEKHIGNKKYAKRVDFQTLNQINELAKFNRDVANISHKTM